MYNIRCTVIGKLYLRRKKVDIGAVVCNDVIRQRKVVVFQQEITGNQTVVVDVFAFLGEGDGVKSAGESGGEVVVISVGVLMEKQIVYQRNGVVLVVLYRPAADTPDFVVVAFVQYVASLNLGNVHLVVEGQRLVQIGIGNGVRYARTSAVDHGKVYRSVRFRGVDGNGVAGKTGNSRLGIQRTVKGGKHPVGFFFHKAVGIVHKLLHRQFVGPSVVVGYVFHLLAVDVSLFIHRQLNVRNVVAVGTALYERHPVDFAVLTVMRVSAKYGVGVLGDVETVNFQKGIGICVRTYHHHVAIFLVAQLFRQGRYHFGRIFEPYRLHELGRYGCYLPVAYHADDAHFQTVVQRFYNERLGNFRGKCSPRFCGGVPMIDVCAQKRRVAALHKLRKFFQPPIELVIAQSEAVKSDVVHAVG